MTARDVILREIGLTPIWRGRPHGTAATTAPASAADHASGTATVAEDSIASDVSSNAPVATNAPPSPATFADESITAEADPAIDGENEAARRARIAGLTWPALVADIAACTACKLCKTRTQTVPGVGDQQPDWFIVGEAPGENEDKQGEPFVGKAGQLLDAMLAAVGKRRGKGVYIANVLKCRPPGNRNPEPDEIAACTPYLQRQVELAAPKLLLAAGKFAAQTLLASEDSVATMRAKGGRYGEVPVVVTYHPSYLLRTPADKAKAWDDLLKARALVP